MSPCPPLEELEALAPDGANANGEWGSHLAHCAQCRSRLDQIRHDNRLLHELRGLDGAATSNDLAGPTVSFDSAAAASERSNAAAPFAASDDRSLLHDFGYEIGPELSRGGQGTVFSAVQRSTHRRVALKVLHPERTPTQRQRMRFEREVEVVARLRHPNIVTVYDSGALPDGRPFYAMELVEGQPLNGWISNLRSETSDSQAPWDRRAIEPMLRLFVKICDAVQYAHQRGVIHRDLKPANILIDREGQPRVLDFGLARLAQDESGAAGFTHTGDFVGTLAYAAPEQLRGDPHAIDVRTDVHALGVILYEMLTGRLPFATDGPLSGVISRIIDQEPPALARAGSRFPKDLSAVVQKALSKEPHRRYSTAGELASDLRHVLADEPVAARPVGGAARTLRWIRRHRAISTVTIAAVLVLGVGGIASLVRIEDERRQALTNQELARDKLRSSMQALEQVFQTEKSLRNVLGTSDTRREMIDVALRFYERLPRDAALLGLEDLAGPHYGRLGTALADRGEVERARQFCRLGLEAARNALVREPTHLGARQSLASALQSCAALEPDATIALQQHQEAVSLLRPAIPGDSFDTHARMALAEALIQLATQHALLRRLAEFRTIAAEAVELARTTSETVDQPAVARRTCDLYRLACQEAHFADDSVAFDWSCDETMKFARHISTRWPADPDIRCDSLRAIGMCAEHLVTRHDLDRAAPLLDELRKQSLELMAAYPRDFNMRLLGSNVYATLGKAARSRQDFVDALRWFDQAVEVIIPAFELQPNDIRYRDLYGSILTAIAATHTLRGDTAKAGQAYETYLLISEPLFAEHADVAMMRAFAWHFLGSAAAPRDPGRASECFRRGREDLARLQSQRALTEAEREMRDMLAHAPDAAATPVGGSAGMP